MAPVGGILLTRVFSICCEDAAKILEVAAVVQP
jgi:hypothetical protein